MGSPISYTITAAAAAVGVSERSIQRAVKRGDLPVKYPTSRPVILADDLAAWVQSAPDDKT